MILTFDAYGTLFDMRSVDAAIGAMAQALGVDAQKAIAAYANWEDRLMYGTPILPYTALIKQNLAYLDMAFKQNGAFANAYPQIEAAYLQLQPFEDVVPALQQLHDAGHFLVVMSNSTASLMAAHQKALHDLIDLAITADDTGCYKPQTAFFDQVAKRLPSGPHLHVAHGFWWDMVPAKALGWRRLWINRDHLTPIAGFETLAQLPDLAQLPTYVSAH